MCSLMTDIQKLTKDTIASGGVLALLYFDVHAKEEKMVQQLAAGFVKSIIERPGVVFAYGEIDKPIGGEDGRSFSSTVEVKVLVKDFMTLAGICIAHSPFNIEIQKPDRIDLPLSEAHDLLMTVSATTADYKRYILTKVAKPEELKQINEDIKARAELGKRLMEKKGKEGPKKGEGEQD